MPCDSTRSRRDGARPLALGSSRGGGRRDRDPPRPARTPDRDGEPRQRTVPRRRRRPPTGRAGLRPRTPRRRRLAAALGASREGRGPELLGLVVRAVLARGGDPRGGVAAVAPPRRRR